MVGTDIMEVQSLLKKLGYDVGVIDGVFGSMTRSAVMQFQGNNGLMPDGIIGPKTWMVLEPFQRGYDLYIIKPGDTFFNIARQYNVSLSAIQTANPDKDVYNLIIGQELVIPFNMDVVDTNISYTYSILERDIWGLKARYPFLEVGAAGVSVLSRNLYYLRLGNGDNEVFYNGAHHGLEWITTPVLMKFAEDFLKAYSENRTLSGYNLQDIWNQSSIYLIPMVNPDGVELVLNGLRPDNPYFDELLQWNGGNPNFSLNWQANNRGVDINHNYDAAWEKSKEAEAVYGIAGPGPTRYSGPSPESEPETRAVVNFTKAHNFRLVMAYHSQGEVIYWNFMDLAPPEAKVIGKNLAYISGYLLDETTGIASYSGYKDWFIQDFRRPGYTIEVGLGRNPLPISQFDKIYRDNLGMLLYAATV